MDGYGDGFEYRVYDDSDYFCPDCGLACDPPGLCEDCDEERKHAQDEARITPNPDHVDYSPDVPGDDDTKVVDGYAQWNEHADYMRYMERDR